MSSQAKLTASLGEVLWSALEQAVNAVVLIDPHKVITFFNAAAERLWRIDRQTVVGRPATDLLPSDLWDVRSDLINQSRDADEHGLVGTRRELLLTRPDGSTFWAMFSLSRIDAEDGTHCLGFFRDISTEHRQREELRLVSIAVNETGRAMMILDRDRRIVFVNRAFGDLFGYTPDEVMGQRPADFLLSPATNPAMAERMRDHNWSAPGFHVEMLARRRNGDDFWLSLTINSIFDDRGELQNMVGVLTDITESRLLRSLRRDMMRALTSELPFADTLIFLCRRIEAITTGVAAAVFLKDGDRSLYPIARPGLEGPHQSQIDHVAISPNDGASGTAAHLGKPVLTCDIATDPRWVKYRDAFMAAGINACWASPIKRADGEILGTLTLYFTNSRAPSAWHHQIVGDCLHFCLLAVERQEAKRQITDLTQFDRLTGLPNRASVHDKAQAITTDAKHATTVAALSIGIDNLHDINETVGHAKGDQLLIHLGNRLRTLVRSSDVVGRTSSDIYSIIYENADLTQATQLAERIFRELASPVSISGTDIAVRASIGIASFPENGSSGTGLLDCAHTALYRAQTESPGRYRFYSPEMNRLARERQILTTSLGDTIRTGGLTLHYHPLVRPRTRTLYGVEALARWTHPKLGVIPPDRFIPLAEETGQVAALGHWALNEACRQMAAWRASGAAPPVVAVNLSPQQFRDRDLPDFIAKVLADHMLPPECLKVEITEYALMESIGGTLDTLRAIRTLGVGLSMDDFGTGYSSLSSLASLPVTEVKIDRSFMRDLDRSASSRSIAKAVIGIGQSLGLTVVAEGVETDAQLRLLIELDCQVAQGYFFTRPLPPAELQTWIAALTPVIDCVDI